MKGDASPAIQELTTVRPKTPLQLFDDLVINDTNPHISEDIPCNAFRNFSLFLAIDSTSTPTTIRFEVQFLDRWSGKWYTYKQGLFSALYYEDTDTANGVYECFNGECLGRSFRIKATAVGASSSAYFTVSVGVDFWN